MPLIYITGVPGTGKSTVRQELLRRGYEAYGGAEDNIAAFYNKETGERLEGWVEAKDRTPVWKAKHTWKIARETAEVLKEKAKDKPVFLCAVTYNDTNELWGLFDHAIALTIDEETLKQRLTTRTNNDVGKTLQEFNDILERQKTAKQKYEALGAKTVDATQPIEKVVDEIVNLIQMPKYGLATFLRPLPDGYEFSPNDWPLHITHIDTVEVPLSATEVKLLLERALSFITPIMTRASADEMFGPNKDILVTRLELTPELARLHNTIVSALEARQAKFKRPFLLKENYRPHVTVHSRERVKIGDVITVDSLSIIEKAPDGNSDIRRVSATIPLLKRS